MMTKIWEIPEIMANGYSSERTQRELSNEYQQDWVKMISIILLLFCALDESNLSMHGLSQQGVWVYTQTLWKQPSGHPKDFMIANFGHPVSKFWLRPWTSAAEGLTLMLLVANFASKKWCKNPEKGLKPWQIGTHLRVLGESYPMNTNMTGFKWFSKSLCHCVLDESSLSMGRVFEKIFENHLNPVMNVGIHWIAFGEYSQMPGFQSFLRFLHHFEMAKLTTSSRRVWKHEWLTFTYTQALCLLTSPLKYFQTFYEMCFCSISRYHWNNLVVIVC